MTSESEMVEEEKGVWGEGRCGFLCDFIHFLGKKDIHVGYTF